MKVICIDDNFEGQVLKDLAAVKKGRIYHVIDSETDENGEYYFLLECDPQICYISDIFLPIPEDGIDEVHIQKERQKEIYL